MIDGHMHLEYGPLTKEYVLEFVEAAKSKGLDEIQILDHSHRFKEFEPMYEGLKKYEVQKTWLENRSMKFKDSLFDYVKLMEDIKKMDLSVRVKYGLEICYTPENKEFIKEVIKPFKFDFLVGAIHSIDDILYDMKFSKELLWDKFDVNHIYKRYYELVFDLVESDIFTQLAHPDTIKLFNYYPSYDLTKTYEDLADLLNSHHMKAECNTGCHYRYHHKDVGLSNELLQIFKNKKVDLITASDAHHPCDVGMFVKEADERIRRKNMYDRIYNFAAGPSQLPIEVLERIHEELFNYKGTGMSVMEMSHRSKAYLEVFNNTKATLRRVMNIPEDYEILFIQGGATEQFSNIAMNFLKGGKADYIITGSFSKKAADEAKKFGEVHIAFDSKPFGHKVIPTQEQLDLSDDAKYVHLCANNTIYGTEWNYVPKTKAPLIVDMSSDILSKPVDVSKYGMIYAGAQKNMGISGMAVVIVRKDLVAEHAENIPVLGEYDTQLTNDSMYNTPSTFSIYVCGLVAEWIESLGGLTVMHERNQKKAKLLYDILDNSTFYKAHADKTARSMMNVTFTTPNEELDAKFVTEAKKLGMESLKGHRSVGGIRASIYNAMPYEGVEKLANFMKAFEKENA